MTPEQPDKPPTLEYGRVDHPSLSDRSLRMIILVALLAALIALARWGY